MKLQYQLSNGTWIDCEQPGRDRTDEFLDRCVKFGGLADEPAVLEALAAGKTVRNDRDDWYSNCRDGEVIEARRAAAEAQRAAAEVADQRPVIRCKSCGATGHAGAYPFSTLPSASLCDDCV